VRCLLSVHSYAVARRVSSLGGHAYARRLSTARPDPGIDTTLPRTPGRDLLTVQARCIHVHSPVICVTLSYGICRSSVYATPETSSSAHISRRRHKGEYCTWRGDLVRDRCRAQRSYGYHSRVAEAESEHDGHQRPGRGGVTQRRAWSRNQGKEKERDRRRERTRAATERAVDYESASSRTWLPSEWVQMGASTYKPHRSIMLSTPNIQHQATRPNTTPFTPNPLPFR